MFFIQILGRRERNEEAADLEELGDKITAALNSQANDFICVAVGKTFEAVMPYVWIRRNADTDEWEGELGDSIKLGIEGGLIKESDPLQSMGLWDAMANGSPIVEIPYGEPLIKKFKGKPEKTKGKKAKTKGKPSKEENEAEAKRMIKDLFKNIYDSD